MTFIQIFAPDLQSGEVNTISLLILGSQELTDFTENCIVYDGHQLNFFSFRLRFHPIWEYQMFDILLLFSFVSNKGHISEWVCVFLERLGKH